MAISQKAKVVMATDSVQVAEERRQRAGKYMVMSTMRV